MEELSDAGRRVQSWLELVVFDNDAGDAPRGRYTVTWQSELEDDGATFVYEVRGPEAVN